MNPLLHRRHPRAAGLSMLEVIVSLGIFVVLIVGISQGLISTRNFVGEDEIRNDLELESLRVLRELSYDLGNAAWFLNPPGESFPNEPDPKAVTPQTYPNVGKGAKNLGLSDWGDQLDFVKLRLKDGTRQGAGGLQLQVSSSHWQRRKQP